MGQNFLRDPNILAVIGREAELGPPGSPPPGGEGKDRGEDKDEGKDRGEEEDGVEGNDRSEGEGKDGVEGNDRDVVLEVGGGEGVLSAYLAPRVRWLYVVEFDERLRLALQGSVAEFENVDLIWGDAMRVEFATLEPKPTKMVANLPYGIAAGILLRTIEQLPSIQMWLVMVQREVGERLAAPPGSGTYGVTSVLAQLAGEVKVVRAIPRTVFRPVPNVDSVLVKVVRTGPAPSPAVRRLIGAAFAHRRKALARSLALAGIDSPRERIQAALVELGHPSDVRAERLSPEDFRALAGKLNIA